MVLKSSIFCNEDINPFDLMCSITKLKSDDLHKLSLLFVSGINCPGIYIISHIFVSRSDLTNFEVIGDLVKWTRFPLFCRNRSTKYIVDPAICKFSNTDLILKSIVFSRYGFHFKHSPAVLLPLTYRTLFIIIIPSLGKDVLCFPVTIFDIS